MKIIYIISFPPKYEYINGPQPDHSWTNNKGEMIGVWRMDRGHVYAKDVRRYFPELEYEVWRIDYRAEKEYIHVFEDGVTHRTFPSQKINFRKGLKAQKFWTSAELISKLESESEQNYKSINFVCHIPLDFSYLAHVILMRFKNKIPFLHTSHLNPYLLKPEIKTLNPIKLIHRTLIRKTYEKHLNLLTEIAVPPDRIDFFRSNTKANVYQLNSLNFNFEWIQAKKLKSEARSKLGLDSHKFILFTSSRLVKEKQIDKMLESLGEIRNLDFLCIISGAGEESYERYLKKLTEKKGLNSKVIYTGFLSHNLIDYYCASDVFISTSISEAGPVSAIKAMALGIPVISADTGIAAYLLKRNNAGIILDKTSNKHWGKEISKVISGGGIKIIDPVILEQEYGLENSIRQLVSYYSKSLNNFLGK